ncbi:MAG: hypothetical protein HC905_28270 [Bacteroidales bacterium]|nr:hypothetical protein [Bacteroidales bacterium]
MIKPIVTLILGLGIFTMQTVKAQPTVYVAGFENTKINDINVSVARYWVNGKPVSLTDGKTDSYCKMITLNNREIYIAGAIADNEGIFKPTYWKNNSPTILNSGSVSAFANNVFVKNNDLYVSIESLGWKPVDNEYWKITHLLFLKKQIATIVTKAIFVDDQNTVYAVGTHIEGRDGLIFSGSCLLEKWRGDSFNR